MAQPESPNAALKALRAKYKKELYGNENEAFLNDILALTIAEVGESSAEAQRAVLETLMNRADAYGRSIKKEYGGGYYQPVNTNTISKQLKRIQDNESLRERIKERLEEVFEGSNESNFALHNGSAGVAKKARELADVRKVIKYGSGSETFYNKTKDDGADHYGSGVIKKELRWYNQFGIQPEAYPDTRPKKREEGASNDSSEYPILSEKTEPLKGEVTSGFVNLAANMFPDTVSSAITSSLPSNIASLPSASKISREILESIQSGEGVQSFTSAVEQIASAETPVGRLQAIGDIATEYEADIKALYPDLASIDFKSAVEGIVNIAGEESPSQRLVSGLKMMETMDPDKLMTVGDVLKESAPIIERNFDVENFKDQPLSTLFDVNKLSEQGKAAFAPYKNIPISTFEAKPESPIAKLGLLGKALYGTKEEQAKALEYLTKGQLPDIPGLEESFPTLLSGSLEDIVQTPIVTEKLGNLPKRILTSERPREIETALTGLAGDIISKETKGAIDRNTSQTLLAGGTEEEVKQMRQTIGGMALDNFVESNPTLKSIIQWFTNNKELVALLGTAGAFAGLTSLLGGGQLKGFATGFAGITGAKMLLGEEGFSEFSGMLKKAASPVFDIASDLLTETGLSEVPLVGSFLSGALDVGKENPLAGIAAVGGNFGTAAGILAASNIGEISDRTTSIIESFSKQLSNDTQVQPDIAATGGDGKLMNDQMTRPTDTTGVNSSLSGSPGVSTQAGMFHGLSHPNYQDFGRTGMGSAAGI